MDMTFVDRALGGNIPYVTYAVPVFFLLIGVELIVGWRERRELYRLNDSLNDLSCGVIQQVVSIFTGAAFVFGYFWLYNHYRLFDFQHLTPAGKWAAALALFLGVDLAYYWFHRLAHEMNAPWATHVVHHQSEEYNLSVALRQGTFQDVFSWAFYTPLVIVGFPPLWLLAMKSFDTLYQFWIHTRAIGRLGPLEWVLNTPSHHRVHHARNPKYLDKNYAGTLIIWDRMFGSFIEEQEEPVYGLTKPLNSWNPLWANYHIWHEMLRDAWLAPRWQDRFKIWFMPPGWRPEGLPENPRGAEVTRDTVIKYDTKIPRGLRWYVTVQFVAALLVAVLMLVVAKDALDGRSAWLSGSGLLAAGVWVIASLTSLGATYERKRWALAVELIRLSLAAAAGVTASLGLMSGAGDAARTWGPIAAAFFLLSAAVAIYYRREFTGQVTYVGGRAPGLISAPELAPTNGYPAPSLGATDQVVAQEATV